MKKSTVRYICFIFMLCVLGVLVGCSAEQDKAGQYAQDRLDCENLMSMHEWYHSAFMNDVELKTIWVQKSENAKEAVFAQNSGYWKGMDKITAYYGAPVTDKKAVAGHFQMHTATTAVVVVAKDRETAKGIFYTPGMIGTYDSGSWMWERYGVDFIREDGVWKIWHLHIYTDFAVPVGEGMGTTGGGPGGGAPPAGGGAPPAAGAAAPAVGGAPPSGGAAPGNQPAATGNAPGQAEKFGAESLAGGPGAAGSGHEGQAQVAPGVWLSKEAMTPSYSAKTGYKELGPDTVPVLVPRMPVPYDTFKDTFSYADPDEYAKALEEAAK